MVSLLNVMGNNQPIGIDWKKISKAKVIEAAA